jgi:UDP-2,3-diacylglucosamine pyrophosphatase LpxH
MESNRLTYAISDLHLGDGGPRDNFKSQQALLSLLQEIRRQDAQLVILGDFLELWQMNLADIISYQHSILDELTNLPAVSYVPGNHDVDVALARGFRSVLSHDFFKNTEPDSMMATFGTRVFKLCHGHEYDRFNKGRLPGVGRVLTIMAGMYEDRQCSRSVRAMLRTWSWVLKRFRGGQTPAQDSSLVQYAEDRMVKDAHTSPLYGAIVCGHTHKQTMVDNVYYNTGSWVDGRAQYLTIQPDGRVDLKVL